MKKRMLGGALIAALVLIGWPPPVESEPVVVFREAPMLRELVEQGLLPPVEERLPIPEDIVVIEPVEEIGQYGGTWRRVCWAPDHPTLRITLYDPAVRWRRDLTGYEPGVFRGWEFNEDGTSITFFLRRGMRWSDGVPFTTDDLRFWWEDLALDEDFGDVTVPPWGYVGGVRMTVDFIDEYTIRFNFIAPNWYLPYQLAQGFWVWEPMMAPRHYLEQFHPRYNPELEGDYTLLAEKRLWYHNPDHPVLFAWRPVEHEMGVRLVVERNPFYWKVDTAGNQLPYIDRIVTEVVPDPEVRLLRLLAGDVDASWRSATDLPLDIPVLKEGAEAAGLRFVPGWTNAAGAWPGATINQDYVPCEYIRELLRCRNFRRGLSHAIDRHHMNDVIWWGMGTVQGFTVSREAFHFLCPEGRAIMEEWAASHIEYDVDLANQLLDAAGLDARCPETGFRLRADTGEIFELLLDIGEWGTAEINEIASGLLEKYWEAVGIKTTLNFAPDPEIEYRFVEGLYMLRMIHIAEIDLFAYPDWLFVSGLNTRMWPMVTKWYATGGAEGWPPYDIPKALHELWLAALAEPEMEKRHRYAHKAARIHIEEGPFVIGVTGGLPMPVFVKENFRNVPEFGVLGPWAPGAPGSQNPEQFFFRVE